MNKKIFMVLWDRPEFYQTLVLLLKYLDESGYEIFLFKKGSSKKRNSLGNSNFGKKCKIFNATLEFKTNNIIFNAINLLYFCF